MTSIRRITARRVIPGRRRPDAVRDEFELALARLALAEDTPMLAVCRGLQVINVAAGGTLIQDIPSEVNQALGHQIDTPLYAIAHEVWVARGSALSNVMQEELADGEVLQVNSRHHQAVKQTAAGFDVCATAPDGIIEAIERPNSRFCIAVQWHPENFWRTGEFRVAVRGVREGVGEMTLQHVQSNEVHRPTSRRARCSETGRRPLCDPAGIPPRSSV